MTSWNPQDDETIASLVDRAVQRDAEAFGGLYDSYVDAIYRYLYFRLGNHSEAEDVCEQVFLKAWEGIDRFRWQGKPFAAWLYRLAHNALVDYLRRRRFSVSLDDHLDRQRTPQSEQPDVAYVNSSELSWAIKQLTEEQQQVVVLKFIQGLSNSEIAELMRKKEGAVRALQLRGLLALRRILSEEHAG